MRPQSEENRLKGQVDEAIKEIEMRLSRSRQASLHNRSGSLQNTRPKVTAVHLPPANSYQHVGLETGSPQKMGPDGHRFPPPGQTHIIHCNHNHHGNHDRNGNLSQIALETLNSQKEIVNSLQKITDKLEGMGLNNSRMNSQVGSKGAISSRKISDVNDPNRTTSRKMVSRSRTKSKSNQKTIFRQRNLSKSFKSQSPYNSPVANRIQSPPPYIPNTGRHSIKKLPQTQIHSGLKLDEVYDDGNFATKKHEKYHLLKAFELQFKLRQQLISKMVRHAQTTYM